MYKKCSIYVSDLKEIEPILTEKDEPWENLRKLFRKEIRYLIKLGVTDFYSGMGVGADLFIATIVLEYKEKYKDLKLFCILPSEEQANDWDEVYREIYFDTLAKADDVIYISKKYNPECIEDWKKYIFEQADIVLMIDEVKRNQKTSHKLFSKNKEVRTIRFSFL